MKSTFSRSFFPFALLLLTVLILVGFFFLNLVKTYLQGQAVDRLKSDCTAISQVAGAYHTDSSLTDREFLVNLSVAAKVARADAVICDETGILVACSDSPLGCIHQGMRITGQDFLNQLHTQAYVVTQGRVEGLYTDNRLVVATAIRDSATKEMAGVVMMTLPANQASQVLDRLTDHYLRASVLVILLAIVLLSLFVRKSSNPLRDLANTAIAFGHGDLKARTAVPENAPEEIRELALAFNNMAGSLEKSESQRQEFVANVSHELKTPMTTISGYVDGILDGTIPSEQQEKYLKIVSDETKRLSRLVRSMLDISRLPEQTIPEDTKARFDLEECIGQVLITFEQRIIEKNLDVQVDMPDLPVYTFACQDAITQVLYNLVDNAVKFCPQGGVLGLHLYVGGNKIYTTVSNTGQDIPAQELPLLFDRFHKVDKSRTQNRDGWGLGLYIVKTIVCSHGENISVSSAEGKTAFTFTLPQVT